ncbi:MAG: hypothetical protein FJ150_08465 [Euryarchaeota archaeon]|nr:hypothetical protein [Euryarchaeota archaeon]
MKIKIIEREVIDPLGETSADKIELADMPDTIEKIALIDNTKPNADVILNTVSENLEKLDILNVKKPAGAAATTREIKEASKADISILAVGDCGSCTTWLILDAIKLEKEGVPTISIYSHKFSQFARSIAKAHGAENLRIVKIEHPISGQEKEDIKSKTQIIIPKIKKMLKIN